MQSYNNLSGYNNRRYPDYNYDSSMAQRQQPQPSYLPNYQQIMDDRVYVSGRAGADAYPLPRGVNRMVLWDNDEDRFYIKGYDNDGRPRVLADNDFQPHVEPEPVQPQTIDMSAYPTKDDIQRMISDAFNNISYPNLSGYVTQNDLNAALAGLSVGNGGRIVRNDESNA